MSEHGLFGSPEWWSAIEKGELTVYTVRGVICDLVMESMNDRGGAGFLNTKPTRAM